MRGVFVGLVGLVVIGCSSGLTEAEVDARVQAAVAALGPLSTTAASPDPQPTPTPIVPPSPETTAADAAFPTPLPTSTPQPTTTPQPIPIAGIDANDAASVAANLLRADQTREAAAIQSAIDDAIAGLPTLDSGLNTAEATELVLNILEDLKVKRLTLIDDNGETKATLALVGSSPVFSLSGSGESQVNLSVIGNRPDLRFWNEIGTPVFDLSGGTDGALLRLFDKNAASYMAFDTTIANGGAMFLVDENGDIRADLSLNSGRPSFSLWDGDQDLALSASAGTSGGLLFVSDASGQPSIVLGVVDGRRAIQIKDEFGVIRSEQVLDRDGSISFRLTDQLGNVRANLGTTGGGLSFLWLLDEFGNIFASLP